MADQLKDLRPNLLDRCIAYFAPKAGAERMQARCRTAAAQGVVQGIRRLAGGQDGTLANWAPRRDTAAGAAMSFMRAMERAESLAENDGHAASCIDALALNVVGGGLRPQSYPDAHTLGITEAQATIFADSMESAWQLWCQGADAAGRLHFDDLQYQAMRSMLVTGEFLHLTLWDATASRSFGMCLQALHPSRLRTPADLQGRADICNGVHLGAAGEPLGYYIATSRTGSTMLGLSKADFSYIPRKSAHRWNVFHCFPGRMPEEVRGTSILSAAMKQFRDLADYVDYELVGALMAASFTVFLETPSDVMAGAGFGQKDADPAAAYGPQMQPGTMVVGQAGHKPHIITSNRPGPTFDAFYERILRAAAASTGQPYEMVAKDFSKTNYSSARAALLEVWKLHHRLQEFFIRAYLSQLWAMVMEEAWLRGLLKVPDHAPALWDSPLITRAWLSAIWTRPPRGQIDPTKEREAERMGLESYTETRTGICHARGLDFDTVARTRQREEATLKKLGLGGTQPAPAQTAAPAPKPAEESDHA